MEASEYEKGSLWNSFQEAFGLKPPSYKSYFKKDTWTIDEFAALMVGLTPHRFKEICEKAEVDDPTLISRKELNQSLKANRLVSALFKDGSKVHSVKLQYSESRGAFFMSCWRYIKWSAVNSIPMLVKFVEELPLILLELYCEFDPDEQTLRTQPKFHQRYHRTLYLKHALELISRSQKPLSRKEIYSHSHMQNIMDSFIDRQGKRVSYGYRTITESWLPKIDKKKRGRPKSKEIQASSK